MPGEIKLQSYSKKSFYYKKLKAIGSKFFKWWQIHITEYLLPIDIIYPINTKTYPFWQKSHNILFKGSINYYASDFIFWRKKGMYWKPLGKMLVNVNRLGGKWRVIFLLVYCTHSNRGNIAPKGVKKNLYLLVYKEKD